MCLGGEEERRLRGQVRGCGNEKLWRDRCGGIVLEPSWREKKGEKDRVSELQDDLTRWRKVKKLGAQSWRKQLISGRMQVRFWLKSRLVSFFAWRALKRNDRAAKTRESDKSLPLALSVLAFDESRL